jgi:Cys-tRNA(Pro)/Cys-tRNA(Cys) deacylase
MAKNKINKTNVARLLDKSGIDYELITYDVDETDLSAQHVASQLDEDIRYVFKTIVLQGDKNGYFVCVVPGDNEIDLKKAAKVSGNKKCEPIHMKELLPLTGYIRGGCSPIGMKKPFPTFIHNTAEGMESFYVSAGMRGMQVKLNPHVLADYIKAEFADVIKGEE